MENAWSNNLERNRDNNSFTILIDMVYSSQRRYRYNKLTTYKWAMQIQII